MYYLTTNNGIVVAVGETGGKISEITKTKYDQVNELLANKPVSEDPRYDYRLREDLEWELFEIDTSAERDELTDAEAIAVLLGGDV